MNVLVAEIFVILKQISSFFMMKVLKMGILFVCFYFYFYLANILIYLISKKMWGSDRMGEDLNVLWKEIGNKW